MEVKDKDNNTAEIISKRQDLFQSVKKKAEQTIQDCENELSIQREIVGLCDKIISEEKSKK